MPEATAIATIGAPADVDHVTHNFAAHLDDIKNNGEAEVSLGGRPFVIKRQFVDDLANHDLARAVGQMRKALLVLHAPMDQTVGIENAAKIFDAAKHPKSFVSLDDADPPIKWWKMTSATVLSCAKPGRESFRRW